MTEATAEPRRKRRARVGEGPTAERLREIMAEVFAVPVHSVTIVLTTGYWRSGKADCFRWEFSIDYTRRDIDDMLHWRSTQPPMESVAFIAKNKHVTVTGQSWDTATACVRAYRKGKLRVEKEIGYQACFEISVANS